MLRFNNKGDFNLSVGNVDFNHNVANALNSYFKCVLQKNIILYNCDFEKFLLGIKFDSEDFIYLDPPYLITFSEYNKLWNIDSEKRLLCLLDELNNKNIRFAISNIIRYKNRYNDIFGEWQKNTMFMI